MKRVHPAALDTRTNYPATAPSKVEEDVAVAIQPAAAPATSFFALEEARKRKVLTIALLRYDGGEFCGAGGISAPGRSDYIPRIQKVQASTYHVLRVTMEVLARA
jgi:D-sedoheptulose 7-phosphate isomerase